MNVALFDTKSTNGYFFYFDASTSTQNLGNLDATYKGGEAQVTWVATNWLDIYAGYGYTDGAIDQAARDNAAAWLPPGARRRST